MTTSDLRSGSTGMTADLPESRPMASRVEAMAGFSISPADIACVLEMDLDEFGSVYAHELKAGHIKANARVAENLFRKATGEGREAVTAAIFWLKTRARWKEVSVHKHAGKFDEPVRFEISFENSRLL